MKYEDLRPAAAHALRAVQGGSAISCGLMGPVWAVCEQFEHVDDGMLTVFVSDFELLKFLSPSLTSLIQEFQKSQKMSDIQRWPLNVEH